MFGHVYKRLTEVSYHYIDWSRFGELLASANHRYSRRELAERGSIAGFTILTGFLGAYFNEPERSKRADLTIGLVSAFLGFVVSHAIVISPLIKKRYDMNQACHHHTDTIRARLETHQPPLSPETRATIEQLIRLISTLSLSNNKHGNASQTWGARKDLFERLSQQLCDQPIDELYWRQDAANLFDHLKQNALTTAMNKRA